MFESLTFANAMATDSNNRAAGERRFIAWCRLAAYERQLAWLEWSRRRREGDGRGEWYNNNARHCGTRQGAGRQRRAVRD